MDEVIEPVYVHNGKCSKARQLLLIIWLFAAFSLTLSYKEVLIANLVNLGYEDTIDDLDDLVRSGIPLALPINSYWRNWLKYDQRKSAIKLFNNNVPYKYTVPLPKWIQDG